MSDTTATVIGGDVVHQADGAAADATQRRRLRRIATMWAGWALLTAGIVVLVLPGPGLLLILGGLALLGREVPWARRLHVRIQSRLSRRQRLTPSRADGAARR